MSDEHVIDFAPRDVPCSRMGSLAGTFKRAENEHAAMLLVVACQRRGAWGRVLPVHVREAALADANIRRWFSNPFFRPDFDGLARLGAIVVPADRSGPIELLAPFFDAIRPLALNYREARLDWVASLRWADDGGVGGAA